MAKEAKARIKINRLLAEAGWRFFDTKDGPANVCLENNTQITQTILDEFGEDFEKVSKGYIDYLLLDAKGFPLIVLEAKSEDKTPLFGKEQARRYAQGQNCRFVILSNGNLHYFWDIQHGNPHIIGEFPTPETVADYSTFKPNPQSLIDEPVPHDYIALSQNPDYQADASWQDETSRPHFIETNKLRFLRRYQARAITSIQQAVRDGKDRFLFEMATGTGKTLVAGAIIKLFLRTGNARRVLFLVDRLELEDQAYKNFVLFLKNDYRTAIYKDNRENWRGAEIVVSTIQTFMHKARYKRMFAPTDFDLVISDEAHRSISGNSRAVFEYFIGYKLGLTATPKDYLKNINIDEAKTSDPRALERRILLDTYKTFGCESGDPTFRYSLLDGANDPDGPFLVQPIVIDARTDITTQLLSEKGYAVLIESEDGEPVEETFVHKDFERKFFSDNTNRVFCSTLLEHAYRDPISGEIGKTIVFCVSQDHAARITQMLNEYAYQMFPGKYNSDFAVQVTSRIDKAQQFSINFTNNNLSGSANFSDYYKTSKTRICVTVGMMTTGYDCQDLLNIALMRPIFSATDFVQIKGRGTRTYNFSQEIIDPNLKKEVGDKKKENFKIFDFFANFEYFETEYDYDQIIPLPRETGTGGGTDGPPQPPTGEYTSVLPDTLAARTETPIGPDGMKIDRMFFQKFEDTVKADPVVVEKVESGEWDDLVNYLEDHILNKPEEYFTLDKLRKAFRIDRRITLKEIIEKVFGLIPFFKTKDELLNEEFDKFDSRYMPPEEYFDYAKTVFKAYVLDTEFREIIDKGDFAMLNLSPHGQAFRKLSPELRKAIPEYIKDFVPLNQFAA